MRGLAPVVISAVLVGASACGTSRPTATAADDAVESCTELSIVGDDSTEGLCEALADGLELPACRDVWVLDATLPDPYPGCLSDDGQTTDGGQLSECAGRGPATEFAIDPDFRLAGVPGQRIVELTPEFAGICT